MASLIKRFADAFADLLGDRIAPFPPPYGRSPAMDFDLPVLRAFNERTSLALQQKRGTAMLRLISYSAIISRNDQLLKDQREIPFTIAEKQVFVPLSLLEHGNNHEKVDRAMSQLMTVGKADPIELELPAGFALANGLPMPASETGARIDAGDVTRFMAATETTASLLNAGAIGEGVGPREGLPLADAVSSISDARTVNNAMRHQYRVLSDLEKQDMQAIKDMGQGFLDYLENLAGKVGTHPRTGSRELSLARTKIEEAVMWAVKHITA